MVNKINRHKVNVSFTVIYFDLFIVFFLMVLSFLLELFPASFYSDVLYVHKAVAAAAAITEA